MHHFHRARRPEQAIPVAAKQSRGLNKQKRPHALAAIQRDIAHRSQ